MAPEIVEAARFYTTAIDVYALAITFWEIVTGMENFHDRSQFEIYSAVANGIRPEISCLRDAPQELIDLILESWHQVALFVAYS